MKHKSEMNEIYEKMSENFYRTKDYIVVQKIFLLHETFRTIVFSIDYYTKRTKEKDKEFEHYCKEIEGENGKRVYTRWFIRKYEN